MTTRPGMLLLKHMIEGLAVPAERLPAGAVPDVVIRSAVIDSRLATPGCLFIALPGERCDGHDFIGEAVEKGAVAVIAERVPDLQCTVLAAGELVADPGVWEPAAPACFVVPDSLVALQQLAAVWRRQHDVQVMGITGSVGKTTSKEVIATVLNQRYNTLKSEGNYLSLIHI